MTVANACICAGVDVDLPDLTRNVFCFIDTIHSFETTEKYLSSYSVSSGDN